MSFKRAIVLVILVCLLALSLSFVGCAEEEEAAAPTLTPGATLVVVPNEVLTTATSVTVYGSGFVPDGAVSLLLVGEWTFQGSELQDPGIDGTIVNEYGAFSLTVKISAGLVTSYGMGAGVYTLKAVQGEERVASACLVVKAPA